MSAANSSIQATETSRARKDCAQTVPENAWRLEPHVCRSCFGRVASQRCGSPGERFYQCTNCGIEGYGQKPDVVCSCGLKLRKHKGDGRSASTFADAGVRCHENHKRSPEFPSRYVASYAGAQAGDV